MLLSKTIKPVEINGMKKNTRNVCNRSVFPPTIGDIIEVITRKNNVPTIIRVTYISV